MRSNRLIFSQQMTGTLQSAAKLSKQRGEPQIALASIKVTYTFHSQVTEWASKCLCHQYPACASASSFSSIPCTQLKPFNSPTGDMHQMKLNWRSLTCMTLIFMANHTGHFQPEMELCRMCRLLQICPTRVSGIPRCHWIVFVSGAVCVFSVYL